MLRKPNIILINCDDLGYGDLGCYGSERNETPQIVEELTACASRIREDLGDRLTGHPGKDLRPLGRVSSARPLTSYDENHPYTVAAYDLADMPVMMG